MTCTTWPPPGGLSADPSPTSPPASLQLGGVPGFRDLLPEEAEVIREAQESLLAEMRRWGYRHVITPMVESSNVLELGLGAEQRRGQVKVTGAGVEVVW